MGSLVFGYDRELYSEAVEAAKRCRRASESEDPEASVAGPAAAAIVLAEASLESFVSESLAVLEGHGSITSEARESIRRKESFWKKCAGLYDELTGDSLHQKPVYYEKLVPLVKLRNHVVHRSADQRAGEAWPEKLAPYRNLIDHVEGEGLHWTSQLLTPPTARWAVRAAYMTRRELHGALPSETPPEKFHHGITTWVLDLEPPEAS